MPEQTYDLMLVTAASLDDTARSAVSTTIDGLIAKGGGVIEQNNEWGERPLAFEIDGETEGIYRLLRFHGPGEMVDALTRQLNITDGLLRYGLIKAVDGAPATVNQSAAVNAPPRSEDRRSPAPERPAAPTEPETDVSAEPTDEAEVVAEAVVEIEAAPAEPAETPAD